MATKAVFFSFSPLFFEQATKGTDTQFILRVGTCPSLWKGGWNYLIFKVPYNPTHLMIL